MDETARTEVDASALLSLALPAVDTDRDEPPTIAGVEMLEPVGQGGMGRVWRGRQLELDRAVAVKVMHPHLETEPAFAARFEREGRLLASLRHPGIVGVHHVGADSGSAYIVMEYVEGRTLRDAMQAGVIDPAQAINWLRQICDALQHAHERGVVHRDIKPENVLLDDDNNVRVTDFGLSVRASGTANTAISEGSIGGTLAYLAPERIADGRPGDAKSDLYAVGVLAYELLTGRLPLGNYEPVSSTVALGRDIDSLLDRALHPEPGQRHDDARSLRDALVAVPVQARPLGKPGEKGFRFSAGDKLAKGLMVFGAVGLYVAFLAGMPAAMYALGVGLILLVFMARLGIVYLRAPMSEAGTRAGFRFLLLVTGLGLGLALAPWTLMLTGLDYDSMSAGAKMGVRVLSGGMAVGGLSGAVFFVRMRGLRLLPLFRGQIERVGSSS